MENPMAYTTPNYLARFSLTFLLAASFFLTLKTTVLAQPFRPQDAQHIQSLTPPTDAENVPTLTYARVLTGEVPIYLDPLHATQGLSPTRMVDTGYVWVTLAQTQSLQIEGESWYVINENEYIQADYLQIFQPSAFQGVKVITPTTFAWMVFDAWTAAAPGELPDNNTILLKRYDIVTIFDTEKIDDRNWYRVGPDQWIEQGMVGIVTPKPRPDGVGPYDKWIEVDLYEQTLAAYEGDKMVYATLVSSGLPWWQTEAGLFQIWIKVKQAKMSGRAGYPDYYFLEDVPWTMYFNHGFALHGAYWHDRFGLQHSHGCVNLTLKDAQWLFEWTTPVSPLEWTPATDENPGTWIWVHDSSQPNSDNTAPLTTENPITIS